MPATPPPLLRLQPGQFLHADAAWLSVVRGRVWVTRANDLDDHFLESGQSMRLERGARALVQAEGPAVVTLAAAPPRRGPLATQWAFRPAWRAWPRLSTSAK